MDVTLHFDGTTNSELIDKIILGKRYIKIKIEGIKYKMVINNFDINQIGSLHPFNAVTVNGFLEKRD